MHVHMRSHERPPRDKEKENLKGPSRERTPKGLQEEVILSSKEGFGIAETFKPWSLSGHLLTSVCMTEIVKKLSRNSCRDLSQLRTRDVDLGLR